MKFITLIVSLFTFFSLKSENDFPEEINNAYDEYVLIEEYSNSYYDLKLYAGIYNNKVYYGILFENNYPGEYYLKLTIDERVYKLKQTSRKDIYAPFIDISKSEQFSIHIYNRQNQYQYGLTQFQNVKVINYQEFQEIENIQLGNGRGSKTASLISENALTEYISLFIAFGVIIFSCFAVIFVYYKKKKGMFNPDIKSNNVFNFKEFLQNSIEEETKYPEGEVINHFEENKFDINDNDYRFEDTKILEERLIHDSYIWQHYEEKKSDFNIKKYLEEQNYNTNYSSLSKEDKNNIMLVLMLLKAEKKITDDDYLDEISELWKE